MHRVCCIYLMLQSQILSAPQEVMQTLIYTARHVPYSWPNVGCHKLAIVSTKKYGSALAMCWWAKQNPGFLQSIIAWNLHWVRPKSASLESRQVFWSKAVSLPGLKKNIWWRHFCLEAVWTKANLQCCFNMWKTYIILSSRIRMQPHRQVFRLNTAY